MLFALKSIATPLPKNVHLNYSENGPYADSEISGIVWYDLNMDGNKDSDETGMPNIPVLLYTCNGIFVTSVITDVDGSYSFSEIDDGSYKLFVSLAGLGNDYEFTFIDSYTENSINGSGYSDCFSTTGGSYTFDGGITVFPYIGDKVWEDINGNGIQDVGEPGIANVEVEVYDYNGLVTSTTTNSYGTYYFRNLFPGQYYLKFNTSNIYLPTTYVPGVVNNSSVTNSNGLRTTDYFLVEPQENNFTMDAGFIKCAKICGIIYNDYNYSDSLNTDENGINELKINLFEIVGNDTLYYGSTFTGLRPGSQSDDGYYEFCVKPGTYFLEIESGSFVNYIPGLPFATSDPFTYNHFEEIDGKVVSYTVTVQSGDSFCNINQGYYCVGSIKSIVWIDSNQNGQRETGEEREAGVVAKLYNTQHQLIKSTISDSSGLVVFTKVKKGTYYIVFEISEEYDFTYPFIGSTNFDSNVDGSYGPGSTPRFTLSECDLLTGIDVGLFLRPLPVKWVSVTAEKLSNSNKIIWKVAQEQNVSHYLVMKSLDGKDWNTTDRIMVKAGERSLTYESIDFQISGTIIYYRIQSVDFDGKISNSDIAQVLRQDDILFSILPNPANQTLTIAFPTETMVNDGNLWFEIVNNVGHSMYLEQINICKSSAIEVGSWPEGIYQAILKNDKQVVSVKKISIFH